MVDEIVCPKCGSRRFKLIFVRYYGEELRYMNGRWVCIEEYEDEEEAREVKCAVCGAEIEGEAREKLVEIFTEGLYL